ncbi:MAG TPA: hypothetical protein VKO63_08210, partial [Chitinispirillaceae bacterium]|nr:hypothetical protein [Chitinispirillaceae bacterium]
KSLNSLRHKDFLLFVYDLHYKMAHHPDIQQRPGELDTILLNIKEYAGYYKEISAFDTWAHIDNLEMNRYLLWEKIIDRLDDNLNLRITDYYGELYMLDLSLENAYNEIPSYSASRSFFESQDSNGESLCFYSEGSAHGHFWDPHKMDFFIRRLISPEFSTLCEITGILSDVNVLEQNQLQLESTLKTFPDCILLNKLRHARYCISFGLSMCILVGQSPLDRYKGCKSIDAMVLFEDRIIEMSERKRLELFSIDLLPLSTFLSIVLQANDVFQKRLPDSSVYKSYLENMPKLLKAYNAFRSDVLWDQFEKEEHAFYKELTLLLDRVTCFTQCYLADNEELYQKFINSDTYDSATTLLYEYVNESTVQNSGDTKEQIASETYCISWEPGDSINFRAIKPILKYWGSAQNRLHLEVLNAEALFNKVVEFNNSVIRTSSMIKSKNPDADLDILREHRYYINVFCNILSIKF